MTVMECLVASVILAMAVSTFCLAVNAGQMQSHAGIEGQRAVRLAEELAERILTLPYDDPDGLSNPGPESSEHSVDQFDSIDDFHGYVEPAGSLVSATGEPHPDAHQVLSRSATVTYTSEVVSGFGDPIPGVKVIVTVSKGSGMRWELTRFVAAPTDGN